MNRHASTTRAALQETGQEAHGAALCAHVVLALGVRPCGKLGLYGIKQFIGDDTQFRHVGTLPFAGRVRTAHALARIRVFDHLVLVPDKTAHVDRIAKDARATILVAVEGGRRPAPLTRRFYMLGVQPVANLPGRYARLIVPEDAFHDFGLILGNDRPAGVRRVGLIAVSLAACGQSLLDKAGHAATDLVHVVLAEKLGKNRAHADAQGVRLAAMNFDDVDVHEFQALEHSRHVFHVAGQPVHLFDNDGIELARFRVGKQV
nr:hypothetical protein [Shinella zoogloeoides]